MFRRLLVIGCVVSGLASPVFAQDPAPADTGAAPAAEAAPAPEAAAPAADAAAPAPEAAPAADAAAAPTPDTSAPAPAAEEAAAPPSEKLPSTSYLYFGGSYLFQNMKLFTDHDRELKSKHGAGVQAAYGQHWANGLGFEITAFGDVIETGKNQGTDFYRPGIGVDLTYSLGDRIGWTPYVLLGGGGVYDDQFPDSYDKFGGYGEFGLGFVTPDFGKGVHLRGEGRYIYDTNRQVHNNTHGIEDVRVGLGLEISLWDKPEITVVPESKPQVVEVVKSTGLEDSDGDGIIDQKDKCPGTPPNTRVDGDGCPLPKVLQLKGVTFEFNKSRLRPDSKTVLDTVVEIMKRYPDMQVEVAGHTDNVGGDAYNQKLSERRAEAVRQYLINAGIAGGNMTAVGYGKKEPIATNDTDEGRELNRRVELRIKN
jgi:OOP family OmpA-OmpF porin